MQIRLQISFILFFILIYSCVNAQCTGGNFGGNLYFTTTQQTIAVTGNTYYTFLADSGDRYFFNSATVQNPGEITILDSSGNVIYAYNGIFPDGSFTLKWKAPYSGVFRALTNLRPCQTSPVNLGSMNYVYSPYKPFPKDSAQWSVRKTIGNPFSQHTTQYKMKGDTTINSINYSKIYSGIDLNYSSPLDTLHSFVREEQRKVYIKYPATTGYDTTDILIYDFNLEEGDTFQVRLLNYFTDSIFEFVMNDIDIYPLSNGSRLYYQFYPTFDSWHNVWGETCELFYTWLEGIGSWLGPFYNEIPQLECDGFNNTEYGIACYWEDGLYHFGGTLCDVNTDVDEIGKRFDHFYPNPSTYLINFQFNYANIKRIEIINSAGSLVETIVVNNSNSIKIDHNLAAGLYLLRFIEDHGTSRFEKIIIR